MFEVSCKVPGFPALYQLRLSGNKFTDNAVQHLEQMPSLNRLILRDTQISELGIDRLEDRGIYIEREN
jgi:hypothetical protein